MTMPKPTAMCCRCFRPRVRTRCTVCGHPVCGRLSCSVYPAGGQRACLEHLVTVRPRKVRLTPAEKAKL